MKNIKKNELFRLKDFLILWSTQAVSQLGSSITAFALTIWLYEKTGSSLSTAALTICSYAPYEYLRRCTDGPVQQKESNACM